MAEKAEFQKISYENLLLDTHNPRLPKSMGNKSEAEIINFFLSDASLVELMLAIGKNDFFEGEQLLVIETDGGKFSVIEGNRRLSAVKLLHKPDLAKIYKSKVSQVISESEFFPRAIPCLIFKDKDEILKYLGFRHITGIKSWKLLEKGRYMTKLKEDFYSDASLHTASREIAKMIGSKKEYVIRVLAGYRLYDTIEKNGFYRIKDLDDTTFYLNYLVDSLRRSNIEQFLGVDLTNENPVSDINLKHVKEWTNWLFNKQIPNKIIGDSEHLNRLNKVLDPKYSKALKVFRGGEELKVAYEYTDGIQEQFEKAIDDAIKHLEKADSLSHKQTEFKKSLEDDLKNISGIIRKIKRVKDEVESEDKEDKLGI